MPRFQQTLLREWIAPQYQEAQIAGPPSFGALTVAGADVAQVAQFVEAVPFGGLPRPRMRVLIVSGGAAAIVDAQGSGAATLSVTVAIPLNVSRLDVYVALYARPNDGTVTIQRITYAVK